MKILHPINLAAGLLLFISPTPVLAHGVIGGRFFPSTLALEDPFANDELSFIGGYIKAPGEDQEPTSDVTGLEAEYAKTITPKIAFSIGTEYIHADFNGAHSSRGFGNLDIGVKYQFYTDASSESVVSASMGASLGNTGDTHLEANDFTTISPAILFAKGFGRLPESAELFRPLSLTGSIELNIPLDSTSMQAQDQVRNPVSAGWGMALMYDLHYLQTSVRDMGIKGPFKRMFPIIELAGETCLNRGCNGDVTAYLNPGIIWIGKKFQLGVEGQIPLNHRTGNKLGVLLQLHVFIDDLFPDTLGHPMFTGH